MSLPSRLEADRDAALRKASDRERLLTELQRTKTLKEKLEELCRSLQKQNRDVAEAEQAKRQELNDKFKTSIDDISSKLQTQSEMHKDNELLTQRLALVTKQSELRDQQQAAELKAKALEAELLDTKLRQAAAQLELARAEQERSAQTETELRTQLCTYMEKFAGFQETLESSNETFTTFKKEMDKMTRRIKKLEREKLELRKKTDASDVRRLVVVVRLSQKRCTDMGLSQVTLIEMATEKQAHAAQLGAAQKKASQLEALCRTLQGQLKAARGECSGAVSAADQGAAPVSDTTASG